MPAAAIEQPIIDEFHRAIKSNNRISVFDLLVMHGNELLEARSKSDESALIHAAKHGAVRVTEYLLDNFSLDVNATGLFGQTALHFAAMHGHLKVLKLLMLQSDINLLAKTKGGFTAYEMAIKRQNFECAAYLKIRQLIQLVKQNDVVELSKFSLENESFKIESYIGPRLFKGLSDFLKKVTASKTVDLSLWYRLVDKYKFDSVEEQLTAKALAHAKKSKFEDAITIVIKAQEQNQFRPIWQLAEYIYENIICVEKPCQAQSSDADMMDGAILYNLYAAIAQQNPHYSDAQLMCRNLLRFLTGLDISDSVKQALIAIHTQNSGRPSCVSDDGRKFTFDMNNGWSLADLRMLQPPKNIHVSSSYALSQSYGRFFNLEAEQGNPDQTSCPVTSASSDSDRSSDVNTPDVDTSYESSDDDDYGYRLV